MDHGDFVFDFFLKKVSSLGWFSVLVLKTQMTLSIGYFIIARVVESMVNYSSDILKQFNDVYNFIYLGIINFVLGFVLVFIFEKKFNNNKDKII